MNTTMLEINEMPTCFMKQANSFSERFKGLMLCEESEASYVLALYPCKQVHTFFMKFPIDVVYCDKHGTVLEIHRRVEPWRIDKYVSKAYAAIEAPTGTFLKNVNIGDVIHF